MDADLPKVSVIIPCRNAGPFVLEAIQSALAQSLAPHEVIVIDDKSDDGTLELLEGLGNRIRLLHGPGQGSAVARNLGLQSATGDWLAFLDADDYWFPEKLERQFADIATKDADAGYTDYRRGATLADAGSPMLEDSTEPCEGQIFSALLRRNFLLTSSIVVRRSILDRIGGFKPGLKGGQDIDLWLRVARVARFAYLREPLTFYRRHPGNITASQKYSYYHAKRWEAVYHEHTDLDDSERAYIRRRWSEALYIAARRAWWNDDFDLARVCFRDLQSVAGFKLEVFFWRILLLLPDSILKSARLGKHKLIDEDEERPGSVSASDSGVVVPPHRS